SHYGHRSLRQQFGSVPRNLPVQPESRGCPVAFHCRGRNSQDVGSFFNRESTEETQFHDALLLRIELRELPQRVIERNQIEAFRSAELSRLLQFQFVNTATAFARLMTARMIHQDVPHDLRGNRKEVRLTRELNPTVTQQSKIGFVDQRRALQSVVAALP